MAAKTSAETLEQTATRDTFEETGIPVELLPVDINTLATTPSSVDAVENRPKAVVEPIAVSQRLTQGVLKSSFGMLLWLTYRYSAGGNTAGE